MSEGAFDDLLGGRVEPPEPPRPARRPPTATELSVLSRVLDDAAELQRKGKVAPRNRDCAHCSRTAELEERAGRPRPMVMQAEAFKNDAGRTYYTGLCRTCTDIEWSANQAARFERAKGNAAETERLTLEVMAREKRGRKWHGQPWQGRLAG